MSLTHINNGDSGLDARNKINASFTAVDALGSAGTSGSSGSSGVNGSSGSSGVNGSSGSSGTRGISGSSGVNGSSGSSGISGGGGAAGLVAGSGTYSIQSDVTLTPGASASSAYSIALGNQVIVYSGSTNSVAIGYDNISATQSNDSVVIGSTNMKTFNGAINLKKSVVLGYGNYINNTNAIAVSGLVLIGENNRANGTVASGDNQFDGSVLIGRDNQLTSGNSSGNVVIGHENAVCRFRNVAVGASLNISNSAVGSVAIGSGPSVTGELGIAIGYNISATGYSLSLGYGSNTNGYTTVGLFGAASGNYSFAASGGSVNATGAMAVGSGASATHNYAYVFGHNLVSKFTDTTHVDKLSINSVSVYADNAAAIAGGLTASQVYRTSTGVLMITF